MTAVASIQTLFPSSRGEAAVAKGIPMSLLPLVRNAFREAGVPVRVAFRGPRAHSIGQMMPAPRATARPYPRTAHSAQSWCLKRDAESFAVYLK